MADDDGRATAEALLGFLDDSPSPYHAAANAARRLGDAGFTEVEETADWTITSPVEDSWFGFRAIAAPADAQNNATILISAWPFEGTSTVFQFTPGGF